MQSAFKIQTVTERKQSFVIETFAYNLDKTLWTDANKYKNIAQYLIKQIKNKLLN